MEKVLKHLFKDEMRIKGLVFAILRNEETGLERVHITHNIVGNEGDKYYAQRGAAETPTTAFNALELGSSASGAPSKTSTTSTITLIGSTTQTVKATYPKTNDGDADNTGAGIDIVTWTFEYSAVSFSSTDITDGIICVSGHGAAQPVLTHFEFTGGAFAKTTSDTLKVIVNHTMNGV